jgi:N-acyl homoserine lactone hydrolase
MRLAVFLTSAASAVFLAACTPTTPAPAEPVAAAEPVVESAPLTVNVLDCGTINISDLDAFSSKGDYKGQAGEFTDTCYLVNHPKGKLLWDLGLPGQLAGQPPLTQEIFTVSLEKTITDQLTALGLTPANIDYVSISHGHFDHVGQADQVAGSTWLVNQKEYDAMFPASGTPPADPTLVAAYAALGGMKREIITNEHDVFGDGSVIIFETPGHTPGHASLQLKMPETGVVLLTGDLYHRAQSRTLGRVPRFNADEAQTVSSMTAFEARAVALNAKVIIQHEPEDVTPLGGIIR